LALAAPLAAHRAFAADAARDDDAYRPHTPTLLFDLSGATEQADAAAIVAKVQALPSVRKVVVDLTHGCAKVRFDSHVVSYHQVAQAIADAGTKVGKQFDPRVKVTVPEYAQGGNAAKVDAIFAGKRLNQRVHLEPIDKARGEFILHFLPLQVDPHATGPQGFNGGHLNHPLHDPPPRGLGLTCIYAGEEDSVPAAATRPTTRPATQTIRR
jgi:copper chaperone CopZ